MNNGDDNNNNVQRENVANMMPRGVDFERLRRQQLLRLGLIVCMILILLDGGAKKHGSSNVASVSSKSNAGTNISQYTKNLNSIIEKTRRGTTFPRNVTGIYQGSWERYEVIKPEDRQQNISTPGSATSSAFKIHLGKFLLQLRSVRIDSVPDMDFVYGVIRIFKAGLKDSDVLYPLQGVYLASDGTLSLLSSQHKTEKLFLQLTDDYEGFYNSTNKNSSSNNSVPAPPLPFKRGNNNNGTTPDGDTSTNASTSSSSSPSSSPNNTESANGDVGNSTVNSTVVNGEGRSMTSRKVNNGDSSHHTLSSSLAASLSGAPAGRMVTSVSSSPEYKPPHIRRQEFIRSFLRFGKEDDSDRVRASSWSVPFSTAYTGLLFPGSLMMLPEVEQLSPSIDISQSVFDNGLSPSLFGRTHSSGGDGSGRYKDSINGLQFHAADETGAFVASKHRLIDDSSAVMDAATHRHDVSTDINRYPSETATAPVMEHKSTRRRLDAKQDLIEYYNNLKKNGLSPLGSPTAVGPVLEASAAVGKTGMKIHIIDFPSGNSKPPSSNGVPQNMTGYKQMVLNPDFIRSIGDGALPETFHTLQASFNLPTQCHFSLQLYSPEYKSKTKSHRHSALTAGSTNPEPTFVSQFNGRFDSIGCHTNFNATATSLRVEFDELEHKAAGYSLITTAICFIQIALMVVQLRHAHTQAAASKISILCICFQALLDACICIGHLLLCAALPKVFFAHLMWVSVLKLLLFGIFEMRTVINIYQARFAQDLATEGWTGLRRRLATVHLRFYGALFLLMFGGVSLRHRPVLLIFIFYSFWVPQIVFSAVSGTRRALHPAYYVGVSITRLFIPLYIFGCPKNFFLMIFEASGDNRPIYSPTACYTLVLWLSVQVVVMLLQDAYGARFFLPKALFPRGYDYHRVVQTDRHEDGDIETGGLHECVICYNRIELTGTNYMVTPCEHVFHTQCLTQWLDVKMECPVCRANLPPLEEE